MKQKLGQMLVEVEVLYYQALRLLSRANKGQRPGAESSIDKLYYSEMDKRHQELIQSILGPYGQLEEEMPAEVALNPDGVPGPGSDVGLQLPPVAGRHHLFGHVRDPEEHHRRARPGSPARGARRPHRHRRGHERVQARLNAPRLA